jgi:16S rRNA (guanine966-N2)-methyltransferase
MRVISGTSKGRRLATPKRYALRPTSDRVKESIFNILAGEVDGRVVLDLFAGIGNLGIEALSRGAKKTLFVERGRQALKLIRRNLYQCGFSDRSDILPKDAVRAIGVLKERGEVFDLILVDPPYRKGWVEKILAKLETHKIYHGDSILVVQHDRREPLPEDIEGWDLIRQRRIGDTEISILTPRSSAQAATGINR